MSYLVINVNGHIFAGTRNSGIYRSTDNGENWLPANKGFTSTRIFFCRECAWARSPLARNFDQLMMAKIGRQ
jgi:hypothetical protein